MNLASRCFVLMLLGLSVTAFCQTSLGSDPCPPENRNPKARNYLSFERFEAQLRTAIAKQDVAALAFLVQFPLQVNSDSGSIEIADAESLQGHFQEVFTPQVRKQITTSSPGDYFCRMGSLAYANGTLWVTTTDRGYAISVVNAQAGEAKKNSTPKLVYTCETKTHRISIEELSNDEFRYRSWNKPKPLTEAPDVDLSKGTESFQGTGVCSVRVYTFSKGNVIYEVTGGLGCSESPEPEKATGHLTVTIAGKQVTDTYCF